MFYSRLISILVLCIASITACDVQPEYVASGKIVKIGVVGPFSGLVRHIGENGLLGIKTALNLQPLLQNGNRLELIQADDHNNPEMVEDVLKRLIEEEEVTAIILLSQSRLALKVTELAEQYQTPVIATVASHPDVADSNWMTQIMFDDIVQGTVSALFAHDDLLLDSSAVFQDSNNPHSHFLAQQFSEKFTAVKGIVINHDITDASENLQPLLEHLRLQDISLLYLPLSAKQVLHVLEMCRKIRWNPQVMVSNGVLSRVVLNHRKKLKILNGVLAIDVFSADIRNSEHAAVAIKSFRKSFQEPGTTFSGLAYEATTVLVHAMNRCNESTNKSCINRILHNGNEFAGLFGYLRIKSDGKTERPVFVNVVENSNMESLVKIY